MRIEYITCLRKEMWIFTSDIIYYTDILFKWTHKYLIILTSLIACIITSVFVFCWSTWDPSDSSLVLVHCGTRCVWFKFHHPPPPPLTIYLIFLIKKILLVNLTIMSFEAQMRKAIGNCSFRNCYKVVVKLFKFH